MRRKGKHTKKSILPLVLIIALLILSYYWLRESLTKSMMRNCEIHANQTGSVYPCDDIDAFRKLASYFSLFPLLGAVFLLLRVYGGV